MTAARPAVPVATQPVVPVAAQPGVPVAAQPGVPKDARVAAGVSCLAGVAAMAAGGLLPLPVAALAGSLVTAAAAGPVLAARGRPGRGRAVRAALGALALAAGTAGALMPGTPLGTRLSVLLCGALLLQQVLADTVRELGTTLVIAAGAVLLAVGLAPGPAVAVPLAVAWCAGVVAAAGVRTAAVAQVLPLVTRDGADGRPGDRRRGAATVVGLTVVAALLGVLLLPRSDGLAARSALAGAGLGPVGGAGGQRTAQAYSGAGVLDMRARGALPATPLVAVAPDSPRLWRTSVMGRYDGAAWYPARVAAPTAVGGGGRVPDVLDPAGTEPSSGSLREDDVRVLGGLRGALVAPGRAVRVSGPSDAFVTDGGAIVAESLRRDGGTYRLTTQLVPGVEDVRGTPAAPGTAASGPRQGGDWTDVPVTVTPRTRDLAAAVTAGADTPAERVLAVQAHLRASYRYDLGSAVPPAGRDAVDHFLFDARSGFCEQFVAAAVVMLRSVDVPARLVTGYAGGEPGDGSRLLRSSDAHAWVEAWVPGAGWVSADPTPTAPTQGLRDRVLATVTSAFVDPSSRRVLALVLLLGTATLVGGLHVRHRRRLAAAAATSGPVPPTRSWTGGLAPELVRSYARLTRVLASAGRGGLPSETLDELRRRVPEAGDGLRVLERAAYGRDPVGTADALRAAAQLDTVSARLAPTAGRGEPGRPAGPDVPPSTRR